MEVRRIERLKMSMVDRPQKTSRKSIDPDEVRELAESIREKGLIEPIIVRPLNGRYEVVAGDRRYLAHRLLGLDEIECISKEMTDDECEVIKATENLQRVDLNPMETASVYGYLKYTLGWSAEKICRQMGRSHETVNKYLRLLELPEEFQEAINAKTLSMRAAEALHKIDDVDTRNYYLRAAVANGVTVEVATRWAEEYNQSKAAKFNPMAGGGSGATDGGPSMPIYQTCHVCKGPTEIKEVQYVPVCKSCRNEIAHAQNQE